MSCLIESATRVHQIMEKLISLVRKKAFDSKVSAILGDNHVTKVAHCSIHNHPIATMDCHLKISSEIALAAINSIQRAKPVRGKRVEGSKCVVASPTPCTRCACLNRLHAYNALSKPFRNLEITPSSMHMERVTAMLPHACSKYG